ERIIRFFATRETDDPKRRRRLLLLEQMIEGGNEFARRQIAACPKDDNRARLDRLATGVQSARNQLVQVLRCIHGRAVWRNRRTIPSTTSFVHLDKRGIQSL